MRFSYSEYGAILSTNALPESLIFRKSAPKRKYAANLRALNDPNRTCVVRLRTDEDCLFRSITQESTGDIGQTGFGADQIINCQQPLIGCTQIDQLDISVIK